MTMKAIATDYHTAEPRQHGKAALAAFPGAHRRTVATLDTVVEELQAMREELHLLKREIKGLQSCSLLYRWHKFLSHRLTALAQYTPQPLFIPRRYQRMTALAAPPTIAIVTPSFNQGHFLEWTLQSVLGQNYPRLEYVVQDGGSRDHTVELLTRYHERLAYWQSQPDRGQAHAINLGFQRARGEIMAYLNSDDILLPGTLLYVARWFDRHPEVDVVYGHRVLINEANDEVGRWVLPPHDSATLSWLDYVPQETLFWRRRIWERVGGAMDESFQFALDWDLILRFRDAGARFARLPRFLGGFRLHGEQKTSTQMQTRGEAEIQRLRERSLGRPVRMGEVGLAVRPYLRRHVLYRHLYRFGLLRH
jgi:glycosyltransferase involved in cell wall biosynthesis